MSRVKPILMKLLEQESRGWFPDYRYTSTLPSEPLAPSPLTLNPLTHRLDP